jgi:hypothetical protein
VEEAAPQQAANAACYLHAAAQVRAPSVGLGEGALRRGSSSA